MDSILRGKVEAHIRANYPPERQERLFFALEHYITTETTHAPRGESPKARGEQIPSREPSALGALPSGEGSKDINPTEVSSDA